jgi:hypothetical protein
MQTPKGWSDSSRITEPSFENRGTTLARVSVGGARTPQLDATSAIKFLSWLQSALVRTTAYSRNFDHNLVMQSNRRSRKLVYIDPDKFFGLVARSNKTERDLCASAGISKEVFDRLIRYGGPVKLSTLTKITTELRVSVTSLVVHRRRQ